MITILITHNTAGPSRKDPGGSKAGGSSSRNDSPRTLLLREGLRIMGRTACAERFSPDMLKCTEDGKPFIPDLPDIHFSLSHSGEYIACAFSDREVGLDLQEHSRVQTSTVRIAKRFFSSAEYEAILALETGINADNPEGPAAPAGRSPLFYRLWSIKEAYLKYLGCGLRGGMNGYLPDPFPGSGPGDAGTLAPAAAAGNHENCAAEKALRGKIRILCDDPLLTPAEYAITPAPENYTIAVCARTLPEDIFIKSI